MTWSHGWLPPVFHFKITSASPAAWGGIKVHRNFSPWTAELSRYQTQTKMFDFLSCLQKHIGVFTVFLYCWTKVVNHSGNFLKTPTPFGIKHPCGGVDGNYQPLSCVCVAALVNSCWSFGCSFQLQEGLGWCSMWDEIHSYFNRVLLSFWLQHLLEKWYFLSSLPEEVV